MGCGLVNFVFGISAELFSGSSVEVKGGRAFGEGEFRLFFWGQGRLSPVGAPPTGTAVENHACRLLSFKKTGRN